MNKLVIENSIKNIIIAVLLIVFYYSLNDFLVRLRPTDYDSIAIVSTLLIMCFLFADYSFTYNASDLRMVSERLLDHSITAIIIFGTGALLEISDLSLRYKLGKPFPLFDLLASLFYVSLVLYDFWDLNRAIKVQNLRKYL